MDRYDERTYGDRIAGAYDELYAEAFGATTVLAVRLLHELAAGGRVLELGIGTGRLAVPLAEMGVEIEGIDASEAMVDKLRAKPGGAAIRVHVGSFEHIEPSGPFSLVFVAVNTFFGLLTQEAQIACLESVAGRLAPGGAFVIEAFVPDLARFDRNQRVSVNSVTPDVVLLDVARHDAATQTVSGATLVVEGGTIRHYPVKLRYAYPAELDVMARLAGLTLETRWGGWAGERFTSESATHVSIYRKPGGGPPSGTSEIG